MNDAEFRSFSRVLRLQLAAVQQHFIHVLLLRAWKEEAVADRVTLIDAVDLPNAMRIVDRLVPAGHPPALASDRETLAGDMPAPGASLAAVFAAELALDLKLRDVLASVERELTPCGGEVPIELVSVPLAILAGYQDWLRRRLDRVPEGVKAGEPGDPAELALDSLFANLMRRCGRDPRVRLRGRQRQDRVLRVNGQNARPEREPRGRRRHRPPVRRVDRGPGVREAARRKPVAGARDRRGRVHVRAREAAARGRDRVRRRGPAPRGGGGRVPRAHPPARALRSDGRPGVPAPPRRGVRRDRARCVRRSHGDASAPPHAGVLRPGAVTPRTGRRDAVREPHLAPEPDRLSTRVDRTLRSVFAVCRTQELGAASRWRNRVYACARHPLDGDATVYSDAIGRADTDAARAGR